MEQPEFKALQDLAYDGTPEEVCKNFKEHAMEALHDVIMKNTKTAQRDQVECERAMHFFDQAFAAGWKEHQTMFTLYMGRAKLNLLIAQFGRCKEDCLEALKIKPADEQMWVVLSRSRYFIEKYEEGLKYARQGLEACPESTKLQNMANVHIEGIKKENRIVAEVETLTQQKTDNKLALYRQLRENKVRLGKKMDLIPAGQEL